MLEPVGIGVSALDPEFEALRALALETAGRAYAPYSHYAVGAAALVGDDVGHGGEETLVRGDLRAHAVGAVLHHPGLGE